MGNCLEDLIDFFIYHIPILTVCDVNEIEDHKKFGYIHLSSYGRNAVLKGRLKTQC